VPVKEIQTLPAARLAEVEDCQMKSQHRPERTDAGKFAAAVAAAVAAAAV